MRRESNNLRLSFKLTSRVGFEDSPYKTTAGPRLTSLLERRCCLPAARMAPRANARELSRTTTTPRTTLRTTRRPARCAVAIRASIAARGARACPARWPAARPTSARRAATGGATRRRTDHSRPWASASCGPTVRFSRPPRGRAPRPSARVAPRLASAGESGAAAAARRPPRYGCGERPSAAASDYSSCPMEWRPPARTTGTAKTVGPPFFTRAGQTPTQW